MEREELRKIVKGLKSIYADPKFIADQAAFDMWYALLKDMSYEQAAASAQMYMMREKFPPTPSDIRSGIVKAQMSSELNGEEAWSLVYKAIGNSTYNSVEEFNKLPENVQKAVGSANNLRSMAMSEDFNIDVEKSLFLRSYQTRLKQTSEQAMLSAPLQNLISTTAGRMIDGSSTDTQDYDNY